MKFLGKYRVGCQCFYCAGPNNSKSIHKCIKHGERQRLKKEMEKELKESKDELRHTERRTKKGV